MPESPPARLTVEAGSLDALFDKGTEPAFPHTSRLVDHRLAEYLQNLIRERRRVPRVNLEISLREPPRGPSEEEAARRDLHAYFLAERQIVALDLRVNQREGWAFLGRTFPLVIVALALAGVLYVFEPSFSSKPIGELVTTLVYLFFITIVWVLLWDPIEKLLFDAYSLRARIAALEKLAGASVRFIHPPTPAAA